MIVFKMPDTHHGKERYGNAKDSDNAIIRC